MRLKAATAREKRVASPILPSRFNSSITPAYCEASVSTATSFQFFAAERSIAGPPMSMFSIASSSVQSGFGHRGLERIEVHHQQVDGRDAVFLQRRHVRRKVAPREQAAVDLRVQGLHPAVEHLREAGVRRHLGDADAFLFEELRGAAGGEDLHAERGEGAREFQHARLVRDADERPYDFHALIRSCWIFLRRVLRSMPSMAAAALWLPAALPSTVSIIGRSMFFSTMS